jgi:hypothetical protein
MERLIKSTKCAAGTLDSQRVGARDEANDVG